MIDLRLPQRHPARGQLNKPVAFHPSLLGVAAEVGFAHTAAVEITLSPTFHSGCEDYCTVPAKSISGIANRTTEPWPAARIGGSAISLIPMSSAAVVTWNVHRI
jgi:hypothetical protein